MLQDLLLLLLAGGGEVAGSGTGDVWLFRELRRRCALDHTAARGQRALRGRRGVGMAVSVKRPVPPAASSTVA
jgi:hypothetical protein